MPDPSAAPAAPRKHHPRWTRARMAEFLRALARTRSVTAAAQAVGMGRQSAYKLRARLEGSVFVEAWDRIAAAPRGKSIGRGVTHPQCRPIGANRLKTPPDRGRHCG